MAHYKGAASEGNRAANLMKKRERQKEELELLKKKIADVCFAAGDSHIREPYLCMHRDYNHFPISPGTWYQPSQSLDNDNNVLYNGCTMATTGSKCQSHDNCVTMSFSGHLLTMYNLVQ